MIGTVLAWTILILGTILLASYGTVVIDLLYGNYKTKKAFWMDMIPFYRMTESLRIGVSNIVKRYKELL